jgi:hypothetical protein
VGQSIFGSEVTPALQAIERRAICTENRPDVPEGGAAARTEPSIR